jgi:hypothetical protein
VADELKPFEPAGAGGELPPGVHARAFVIRPVGPAGKLALAVVLVAAGAVFFTLGLALLAAFAVAATATGLGVVAYRALGGKPPAGDAPPPLDPAKEIFLKKPEG